MEVAVFNRIKAQLGELATEGVTSVKKTVFVEIFSPLVAEIPNFTKEFPIELMVQSLTRKMELSRLDDLRARQEQEDANRRQSVINHFRGAKKSIFLFWKHEFLN